MPDALQPHGLQAAYHAPLSMGFSRQEYWSGVPLPSPIQMWMIRPLKRHIPTGSVTFLLFKYIHRTGEFDENGNDDCTTLTV